MGNLMRLKWLIELGFVPHREDADVLDRKRPAAFGEAEGIDVGFKSQVPGVRYAGNRDSKRLEMDIRLHDDYQPRCAFLSFDSASSKSL